MRLKIFFILLFTTGLLKVALAQNYYFTLCDSFELNAQFRAEVISTPITKRTFSNSTIVYCSPGENSRTLGALEFNSEIQVLENIVRFKIDSFYIHYQQSYQYRNVNERWGKIAYKDGVGYVRDTDLAMDYLPDFRLLIRYGYDDEYGEALIAKVAQSRKKQHELLDEYRFPFMHGYRIKEISKQTLSNHQKLICYETYRESCPGATHYELVLLGKKGFTKVLDSFCTGEAGTFDCQTIYLPIMTTDSVVKLAPLDLVVSGKKEKRFKSTDFEGFPYPKNIDTPIEKLIVRTHSYTNDVLDEVGNPIMENEYEIKVTEVHEPPSFYQWNGQNMTLLGADDFITIIDSLATENLHLNALNKSLRKNLITSRLINIPEKQLKHNTPKTKNDSGNYYYGFIIFLLSALLFYILGRKTARPAK